MSVFRHLYLTFTNHIKKKYNSRTSLWSSSLHIPVYRPLEQIRDNYPKFLMTTDFLLQKRNGIKHVNLMDFMKNKESFSC